MIPVPREMTTLTSPELRSVLGRLFELQALESLSDVQCYLPLMQLEQDGNKENHSRREKVRVLRALVFSVPVVVKLSVDGDNQWAFESEAFRVVARALLERHWSPHITQYVGHVVCERESFLRAGFPPIGGGDNTATALRALIVERADGVTLREWGRSSHTIEQWAAVLFQVLWTLECFGRVGFRHNDLHPGNIMVADYSARDDIERYNYYEISRERVLRVPTRTCYVKLIDLDQSGMVNTGNQLYSKMSPQRNPWPEASGSCSSVGICNERNRKFDAFTLLANVWANINPSVSNEIYDDEERYDFYDDEWHLGAIEEDDPDVDIYYALNDFIWRQFGTLGDNQDLLHIEWPHAFALTQLDLDGEPRGGNWEPDDRIMAPVSDMLGDELFTELFRGGGGGGGFVAASQNRYRLPSAVGGDNTNYVARWLKGRSTLELKRLAKNLAR